MKGLKCREIFVVFQLNTWPLSTTIVKTPINSRNYRRCETIEKQDFSFRTKYSLTLKSSSNSASLHKVHEIVNSKVFHHVKMAYTSHVRSFSTQYLGEKFYSYFEVWVCSTLDWREILQYHWKLSNAPVLKYSEQLWHEKRQVANHRHAYSADIYLRNDFTLTNSVRIIWIIRQQIKKWPLRFILRNNFTHRYL